jgi:predicted neuraminidase
MKGLLNLAIMLLFSILSIAQEPVKDPNPIIESEYIYLEDEVSFPSCHASTIEETEHALLAAWFGGTSEKDPDVGIWLSRKMNGKWSSPLEVVNGIQNESIRYPTWNPVLFQPGDGPLMLFYKVGPDPRRWWGMITTSDDEGLTWSKPAKLGRGPSDHMLGPIKNKPVQLEDGSILCPSSSETRDKWRVHFELSTDMGQTWEFIGPINDGREFDAIQPSVLFHSGGRLQVLCRTKQGVISQSWSEDQGRSWSPMNATMLPNPNSGTDAVTLKDGRQILVYNHIVPDQTWGSRSKLNMAVSEDGINWSAAALLENDPDPDSEYSYPAVIQTRDGKIHVTYTWNRKLIKHVVLDPSKIEPKAIVDGVWPETLLQ